jgi:hypothetical protein
MSEINNPNKETSDSVSYPKPKIPFHQDPNWVEAPGCVWTPQLEESLMPSRFPTAGEKAETTSHRGAMEGEYEASEVELQAADDFAVFADGMNIVELADYLGETLPQSEEEENLPGD